MIQVSGTGYNDQGEVHLLKSCSSDLAKQAVYNLLEVCIFTSKLFGYKLKFKLFNCV